MSAAAFTFAMLMGLSAGPISAAVVAFGRAVAAAVSAAAIAKRELHVGQAAAAAKELCPRTDAVHRAISVLSFLCDSADGKRCNLCRH